MEIRAVSEMTPLFMRKSKPWIDATTLKTHAFVVLSYLLIGIGIVLACTSFYMATTMPPMLAIAGPAAPLALGVFLNQPTTPKGIAIPGQPLGFTNRDNSTCWLNAATQVLFNSMQYCVGDLPNTNVWLFSLRQTYRRWCKNQEINTQSLRSWLSRIHGEIAESHRQEDPGALFEVLYEKMGVFLPIMKQVNDGEESKEQDFYISIPVDPKQSFSKLFNSYFDEPGSPIRKWMTEAPRGFLVKALRANWVDGKEIKSSDPVEFPMQLELSKEQCHHGNRNYSPNGFILHHGGGVGAGHYTAVVKTKGFWWHLDDSVVTQLSDSEAETLLQKAYFVHYSQST